MSENDTLTRDELIAKAKELYSKGSRNYLLKCYNEAADELSEVCALYEEIYGELSDELGMPYMLYAKSLISLAIDENKVIDVPDEEEDENEDEDVDDDADGDADENEDEGKDNEDTEENVVKKAEDEAKKSDSTETKKPADSTSEVLSKNDNATTSKASENGKDDTDKPSTSNGIVEEDEENEAASSLQLAWEILELAAKIFKRQGLSGLPNLAEVQTELANIEFENNILDAAREDYNKALNIYKDLTDKYRRAMAEIHYKIGLTYLMQQLNQEGADSLKNACALIEDEINELKAKDNLVEKDTEVIKDMEETKQEIWAKIAEIEETRQQNIVEVRAALDSYINAPKEKKSDEGCSNGPGSSSSVASSSKPTDITHLIKRKKPDTPACTEQDASPSPAKKAAV